MAAFTKYMLLLLTLFVLSITLSKAIYFSGNVHVHITNDLQPGLNLTFHCKSGDNDLRERVLSHGQTFDFHFRKSVYRDDTLFYCSFAWNGAFHWFEIYNQLRDDDYCEELCDWKIREDGPRLMLNDGKIRFMAYEWKD